MTTQSINTQLKKIEACRQSGHTMEGLLMNYHLNLALVHFILASKVQNFPTERRKAKEILKELKRELVSNAALKSVFSKKNAKPVMVWFDAMEDYFKQLKVKRPSNTRELFTAATKITALLNLSIHKLHPAK